MWPMIYVAAFLAAFLAVEGIYFLIQEAQAANPRTARRRLQRLAGRLRAPEAEGDESILRRRRTLRFESLVRALPRGRALELRIYRAGLTLTAQRFLALSLLLAAVGWGVGTILFGTGPEAFAPLALGLLPWLQVRRLERRRMQKFEQQFPDALEMLTRALRAGHSLTFGLQMVSQELADPIGGEFAQVSEEIKLGQDARNALGSLAYRLDSPDLSFFVTAILIQRESGGNLAEVLENLSHVIRQRLKLYGKVRSLTAMARASAGLLAVWPVLTVVLLQLINPEYIEPLWKTQVGQGLGFVAAALVVVGYVLCRRMAIVRV